MDESVDTKDQCITVDLCRTLRKETGLQFVQHILGYPKEKGILTIGHIRDAIRKRFEFFFVKFLLVTLVGEEAFTGDDLADEIPIVAAPFTAGEFDSAVFVNTIHSAVISDSCAFAGFEAGYFLW